MREAERNGTIQEKGLSAQTATKLRAQERDELQEGTGKSPLIPQQRRENQCRNQRKRRGARGVYPPCLAPASLRDLARGVGWGKTGLKEQRLSGKAKQ